ncbi:GNAT family N-acetyltransferase [Saccharothrix lopnurensis]|uniref:GNAT family N-acetyltransferase n=1 Tax=Saccharothrix lopnurensis TaxID=1670621 RepID=A0ABW1NXE2_9PSEU
MQRPREIIDRGDLTLRRWRADRDFEPLSRVIGESLDHLRPWMPWVAHHSAATTRAFLAGCDPKWRAGEAYNYAIVADGELVGSCSMYRSGDTRGMFMGYWLHPAATGRGLATRAAEAMAAEAFTLPGVDYLEIVHDLANTASGAVPRRLGFTEVGRERAIPPGAPSDSGVDVVWRLTRDAGS